ncbi:hypothetical protein [Sciscionella sediminilitoris]|nr:hypothetical protein [Sciscionella sp. SE31]
MARNREEIDRFRMTALLADVAVRAQQRYRSQTAKTPPWLC